MVIMWYNEDVLKSILIHMARLFSQNMVIIPISISWLSDSFCPQTDKHCMLSVYSSFTNQMNERRYRTVLIHISITTSEFAFHLRLKQVKYIACLLLWPWLQRTVVCGVLLTHLTVEGLRMSAILPLRLSSCTTPCTFVQPFWKTVCQNEMFSPLTQQPLLWESCLREII